MFLLRTASLHPLSFHFHGATGAEKPDSERFERGDCDTADVQATVVAIDTQGKKGVPSSAVSTALSRLAVFSLVPTR